LGKITLPNLTKEKTEKLMNYRLNFQIRVPTVRLIDENGKMIGIVSNNDAQKMAQNKNLDLVEIDGNQKPPICKIMNFGKFKYETEKKEREIKKASKVLPVKEIQFSPNVEENDVSIKTRKIREFIGDGHKVKISMRFKGRDIQHVDLGRKRFQSIIETLSDICKVEQITDFNGNTLTTLLGKK